MSETQSRVTVAVIKVLGLILGLYVSVNNLFASKTDIRRLETGLEDVAYKTDTDRIEARLRFIEQLLLTERYKRNEELRP